MLNVGKILHSLSLTTFIFLSMGLLPLGLVLFIPGVPFLLQQLNCRVEAQSMWNLSTHLLPLRNLVLRHSFYFYFYFEHLNFTWSYLIDMKISWSLDHISWSYLLIISWRSYLLIYDLILISWSYHLMMIQDMFLYMNFTLLLTCIRHALDSCLSLTIDMHSTHVAAQHAFTLHLTCFGHTFYMCVPWGQHMDISI